MMLSLVSVIAAAFSPCVQPYTSRAVGLQRRTLVTLKQPLEDDGPPPVQLISLGSICEFDDGKHARSMLGVVRAAEAKAKGGARYSLEDATGKTHSVNGKSIHCSFSASAKVKGDASPESILSEFTDVMETSPVELFDGVNPEMIELAWEVATQSEHSSLAPESILGIIDEQLIKGSVAQYKAFRLLHSSIGKIFFKALSGNRYKAKLLKSVEASKQTWCKEGGGDGLAGNDLAEFCYI